MKHGHAAARLAVLRAKQKKVQKTSKLGGGARFRALKAVVSAGGARNPGAVAAAIGRKKYGATAMARLSAMGRKGRR